MLCARTLFTCASVAAHLLGGPRLVGIRSGGCGSLALSALVSYSPGAPLAGLCGGLRLVGDCTDLSLLMRARRCGALSLARRGGLRRRG